MKTKKINAFTLFEVTFAMLLSALCIAVCYTAYGLISDYYSHFRDKNEQTDEVLALKHVLERDFLKSKAIIQSEKGFEVILDSASFRYQFENDFVIRKVGSLHTDTFKLKTESLAQYFEGNEVSDADTLDQIRFTIRLKSALTIPIGINKVYSATDLYK